MYSSNARFGLHARASPRAPFFVFFFSRTLADDVIGVGPAPCSNVTIRRTNVVSRNICVGGATEGGVSNVLFEDVSVGDPNTVTSPWAIKFKVSTGLLRNVTFRRLKIGKIGNTPWMYPTRAPGDAFHIDVRPPPNATYSWLGLEFDHSGLVSTTVPPPTRRVVIYFVPVLIAILFLRWYCIMPV